MSLVLGYHGCDLATAQSLLGGQSFLPSKKPYDWLGPGVYFWENDPVRAYQWAIAPTRGCLKPSLVGAIIELGNCFDLSTQTALIGLSEAHKSFVQTHKRMGREIPKNSNPAGSKGPDRVIRRLDCAVINHFFFLHEQLQSANPGIMEYETVRSLFPEGKQLYPNSGFKKQTHIQICVRNHRRILGVFRLPEWQRTELKLPELY